MFKSSVIREENILFIVPSREVRDAYMKRVGTLQSR